MRRLSHCSLNSLEIKRRVLGHEHPETLSTINNLAGLFRDQGKYAQAEPLLTKVLEVRRRVLGQEHPDTLLSMNNLALLYLHQSKYRAAEAIYIKVLEFQRHVLAAEHPRRLASMNDLAALYIKTHKYAMAEPLLREALNSHDKSSPNSWVRYNCQSLLSASLAGQRRYAEAESLLLSGYQGMLLRKTTIPWERRSALNYGAEWILQLYESWGKPDGVVEWRDRLQMKAADHLQP
jgi:tetratricopeptide (TPR) repeat protein